MSVVTAPRGRRTRRSAGLTAAVALIVLAAALVAVALVVRGTAALAAAGVLAVVAGAASYSLVRRELVLTRRECAVERRDLARSYRDLFDRRAGESAAQQARLRETLGNRVAEEQRTTSRLRDALGSAERRAVGSESMLDDVRRRLAEAEERHAAMAAYVLSETPEDEATVPIQVALETPAVPEWARLEADPVEALLAWEQHAGRVTGTHREEHRKPA